MYADNYCTYTEKHDLGIHKYIFKGPCIMCTKEQTVEVRGIELYKFYENGARIQEALSNNADEREFLMSGICPKCWENTFSSGTEEDELPNDDFPEFDEDCPMCGGTGYENGDCNCVEVADLPKDSHPMAEDAMEECDGCGLFMYECECHE